MLHRTTEHVHPSRPESTTDRPWHTRVDTKSFIREPITDKARIVWLALEERSRDKPYCWPGNNDLCEILQMGERKLQEVIAYLETKGYVARIMTDRRRPERLGFLMLKRVNTSMPACTSPDQIREIATRLRANWAKCHPGRRTALPGVTVLGERVLDGEERFEGNRTHKSPSTPFSAGTSTPKRAGTNTPNSAPEVLDSNSIRSRPSHTAKSGVCGRRSGDEFSEKTQEPKSDVSSKALPESKDAAARFGETVNEHVLKVLPGRSSIAKELGEAATKICREGRGQEWIMDNIRETLLKAEDYKYDPSRLTGFFKKLFRSEQAPSLPQSAPPQSAPPQSAPPQSNTGSCRTYPGLKEAAEAAVENVSRNLNDHAPESSFRRRICEIVRDRVLKGYSVDLVVASAIESAKGMAPNEFNKALGFFNDLLKKPTVQERSSAHPKLGHNLESHENLINMTKELQGKFLRTAEVQKFLQDCDDGRGDSWIQAALKALNTWNPHYTSARQIGISTNLYRRLTVGESNALNRLPSSYRARVYSLLLVFTVYEALEKQEDYNRALDEVTTEITKARREISYHTPNMGS